VLDNAPRNALTTAMFEELGQHIREIERDTSVGAVVVQGAGPHLYTVGADIREMDVQAALADRQAATRAWLEPIHRVLDALAGSSKVYLCAMKGIAYGGGLELAAACDIRLAAEDARFAMPEVKLGIIPGYGGTQRLTRLIGVGHTLALVLSARETTIETARMWGLVDLVTPVGEAEATARALAEQIAGYGPLALSEAKHAIRHGVDVDLARGLAQERESFVRCATSADFDEGRRAFIEKRAPLFALR
jgi:enoyl-CoA hydratase/carnithine racemase